MKNIIKLRKYAELSYNYLYIVLDANEILMAEEVAFDGVVNLTMKNGKEILVYAIVGDLIPENNEEAIYMVDD
jgi:hypothetical protein